MCAFQCGPGACASWRCCCACHRRFTTVNHHPGHARFLHVGGCRVVFKLCLSNLSVSPRICLTALSPALAASVSAARPALPQRCPVPPTRAPRGLCPPRSPTRTLPAALALAAALALLCRCSGSMRIGGCCRMLTGRRGPLRGRPSSCASSARWPCSTVLALRALRVKLPKARHWPVQQQTQVGL